MGTGVSLILIAAGAILTWAVDATVSGLNIHAVGVILMVVGIVGLVLSLVFWSSWGGFGATRAARRPSSTRARHISGARHQPGPGGSKLWPGLSPSNAR